MSLRRVLLVEDEMLVAMSVEDALAEAGWEVVGPVTTVAGALEFLQTGDLDAAVLDMNLNGQSGSFVADALERRNIPFIILSGYGAAGLPSIRASVPVFSKPFDPEQLTAAMRQLLSKSTAKQATR